jgi:hypothetical protein
MRRRARTWAVRTQAWLPRTQKQAEGGTLEIGIAVQEVAQTLDDGHLGTPSLISEIVDSYAARAAIGE